MGNSRNQGKGNMKKNKPFNQKKKPTQKIAVDKQVKDPEAGMRLNKYIVQESLLAYISIICY